MPASELMEPASRAEAEVAGARSTSAVTLVIVSLLFVLSGATGLAYEIVWFKRFAQVWGASSASTAAVVACFLFGLGLGARLFGGLADRVRRPLALYALCEVSIGGLAVVAHFEIGALFPVSAWAYAAFAESPLAFAAVRFLVTFVVIGPPTVLMGATLPLIVRHFAAAGSGLGAATSWLYFANSLGAALGAWVTGFHLLPALGLVWTNSLVVALNLLVALLAWIVAGEAARGAGNGVAVPTGRTVSIPGRLLFAALATGTASIALQMVWTRGLSVIVGGTTYAFTAIVCVFILGLAAGSLAYRIVVRETTSTATIIGIACLGVVGTTLLGRAVQPDLGMVVGQLRPLRAGAGFNALLCMGTSFALLGLPTFFMGLLFPALVQHTRAGREGSGLAVGRLYAWNTAGAIVGAMATAPLLLPALGSFWTTVAALAIYPMAVFVLFPPTPGRIAPVPILLGTATLALTLLGGVLLKPDQQELVRLNMGQYLYGEGVYESLGKEADLLFFREAPTANVMVLGLDGAKSDQVDVERLVNVRVNGKVDGSNAGDRRTQAGTAYLARFLRPEAEDVLVIGFGTGTTAGASLLFEGTRVDCCEIERAMFDVSPFFHGVNHAPELSPQFRAVLEDGRNHVQSTDRSYDLIISEPSNPWIAGIANLYTLEFYREARLRLKPGGMIAQWIQGYQLSGLEFSLIVNTIQQVFEHTALIWIDSEDLLLVASATPVLPDRATADRAQALVDASYVVGEDLRTLFGTTDVRSLLLAQIALGREGLERLVVGEKQGDVNTDMNLRLEFDAPLQLFGEQVAESSVLGAVLASWDARPYYAMIQGFGFSDSQLEALRALRQFFFQHGEPRANAELAELVLTYSDAPEFLADRLLFLPSETTEELQAGVRRLGSLSVTELQRLALGLAARGDAQPATFALEELAARAPGSATAWAHLAMIYDLQGRIQEADVAAGRALDADPLNEVTKVMVEALRRNSRLRREAAGDG